MSNKEVIIAVRGGIATVIKQPDGVDVHIRDYDLDGCRMEDIQTDENGFRYVYGCKCCS